MEYKMTSFLRINNLDVAFFSVALYSTILISSFGYSDQISIYLNIASSLFFLFLLPFRKGLITERLLLGVFLSVIFLFFFFFFSDPVNQYGFDKRDGYVIYFLSFFLYLPLILYREYRIEFFLYSILLLSLLTAIFLIFFGTQNYSGRNVVGDSNPIWVARSIGWGLVITPFLIRQVSVSACLVLLMFFAMVLTGSRGPVLGVFVCALFHLCFSFSGKISKTRLSAIIFFMCGIVVAFPLIYGEYTFGSDRSFITPDSIRLLLIEKSLRMLGSDLLGHGLGAFSYGSGIRYPHNQFLEVAVELGVFFAFALICFVGFSLISFARSYKKEGAVFKSLALLFVFSLFNSLISGDILSPKMMYMAAGILVLRPGVIFGSRAVRHGVRS